METLGWVMITLGTVVGGFITLIVLAAMLSDDD
jgi:hypothetical protein